MSRHTLRAFVFALLLHATPSPAQSLLPSAPVPPGPLSMPSRVLSANPFALLFDFFNSEYEIRGSDSVTFGAGASTRAVTIRENYDYAARTSTEHQERYLNGDVFVRYYPGGRAFSGRSFGLKAGFTRIPSQGSYFGIGFDANRSWMLNEHFFFGSGIGLKRLIGTDDRNFDLKYIPTLRMNIGVGF